MSDALRIALVGNPNCGKTSLFNHLTGTRQKVGNYAGVTVERKVGQFTLPSGQAVRVLDLPGTYSLEATSPDEAITRDVVQGKIAEEGQQDAFLCVVDATNLKLHLGLVLEMIALGRPILLVLNMMDEARRRGMQINTQKLSERLGVPVVETVAVRDSGIQILMHALDQGKFTVPQTESLPMFPPGKNAGETINPSVETAIFPAGGIKTAASSAVRSGFAKCAAKILSISSEV